MINFLKLAQLSDHYRERQIDLLKKRADKKKLVNDGMFKFTFNHYPVTNPNWKIELPKWCQDQRNQMTGPADDMSLLVKMQNSGAPGVMIDLEDSMVNSASSITSGIQNATLILHGLAPAQSFRPVTFVRPRGLHLDMNISRVTGKNDELCSASFYDVTRIALNIDPNKLQHPLCFYIPKSESAEEALWWSDLFKDVAAMLDKPSDWIKCMALVESFPIVYELDEFVFNLKDHIIGLNLGRWDYLASLFDWNMHNKNLMFCERDKIPHDQPFFQDVRKLMVETCHKRGILAIGGMTALFPNRNNKELNDKALQLLKIDKQNEASLGMDGAWTGHPDQNEIAINSFPSPNQLNVRHVIDKTSLKLDEFSSVLIEADVRRQASMLIGTKKAIRSSILYRFGVFNGKGASLIDGYMEDLATDRINRLMLAQRLEHNILNNKELLSLFNDETTSIIKDWNDIEHILLIRQAATTTFESIIRRQF